MLRRTIANIDVQWRESARHCAISERRKSVDRIELIALTGNQCDAKVGIEKVFAANGDRQGFIRLRRERIFGARQARRLRPNTFGRASREETIRESVLDFIRVGDRVYVIEAN